MLKRSFCKVCSFLVVSVVSCLLPLRFSYGQAVEQEISVLGAKLHLGMTKATTFSPFNAYHVTCIGSSGLPPDCDSWLIQSNGPPYIPYANLLFKEGKLKSIWKYWDRGFDGTQPNKFADTLHAILSQYGDSEMTVQTKEQIEGGVTQRAIFITKGRRTVVISTTDGVKNAEGNAIPAFVNMYEMLQ